RSSSARFQANRSMISLPSREKHRCLTPLFSLRDSNRWQHKIRMLDRELLRFDWKIKEHGAPRAISRGHEWISTLPPAFEVGPSGQQITGVVTIVKQDCS